MKPRKQWFTVIFTLMDEDGFAVVTRSTPVKAYDAINAAQVARDLGTLEGLQTINIFVVKGDTPIEYASVY